MKTLVLLYKYKNIKRLYMQKTNNLSNKSLLITGILTIVLGLILGIITIILNLNKYISNINSYNEENKVAIEIEIKENDEIYNKYVEETKELNQLKQNYQKELSELSKTSNNFSRYLELENEISSINTKLEELEQLKYSSLTEKNNLRKKYNEIVKILEEKESPKKLIKCYLVGFAIILVTVNTGAYFIHLAFQPDLDDIILKNQLKIDKEREQKEIEILKTINNDVIIPKSDTNNYVAKTISSRKNNYDKTNQKNKNNKKVNNQSNSRTNKVKKDTAKANI